MNQGIFCLKCIDSLKGFTDQELQRMFKSVSEKEFETGEIIYAPAQVSGRIFFIREGEVDIYQKSTQGKKYIFSTLGPGDMFGDMVLLQKTGGRNENFARAATRTKVCQVDKLEFMNYLQIKPDLAVKIIEELSRRLADAELKVRDLALNNVQIRLLNELNRLADQFGQELNFQETLINKRLTHEELSERISATRETVSKVIKFLAKSGFLRYDDKRNIILNRNKVNTNL